MSWYWHSVCRSVRITLALEPALSSQVESGSQLVVNHSRVNKWLSGSVRVLTPSDIPENRGWRPRNLRHMVSPRYRSDSVDMLTVFWLVTLRYEIASPELTPATLSWEITTNNLFSRHCTVQIFTMLPSFSCKCLWHLSYRHQKPQSQK